MKKGVEKMKVERIVACMDKPYRFKKMNKTKRKKNDSQKKNIKEDSVFISNKAKKLYEKSVQ